MKFKVVLLSLLLTGSAFLTLNNIGPVASAQTTIVDDTPMTFSTPGSDEFEFIVNSYDHAVIGIRPPIGADYDINVYTDTTFATWIEGSAVAGSKVEFVTLDKNIWASPPDRGAIVSVATGTGPYQIELENDVPDYLITDTWTGSMDASLYGSVLDLGPPGSWEDAYVYAPTVHYDGTTYHMWYGGNVNANIYKIGYANSSDGIKWTKYPANPVLTPGPNPWDSEDVGHPTVLYDGTAYHMWYGGTESPKIRIGYATSSDGITWTKSGAKPVLDLGPPGSWDDTWVSGPSVLYDGITYHMWYHGLDGTNYRIGYASSPDGVTWTKYAGNPVINLGLSGSWEDTHVNSPMVLYDGITYHIWYKGHDGTDARIGYASSPDGITWTKYAGNPVLDLGSPGSWDDTHVAEPTVLYDGTKYHMWYSGHDGANFRIGYATSSDGITWTKFAFAEVLDAYEITSITAGFTYTITLDAPPTADLDLLIFDTTGGRDNAVATSTNIGAGIDESLSFSPPTAADYLLVITNENGGTGTYTVNSNQPPIAYAGEDQLVFEGDIVYFDGSGSYDTDGNIVAYEWDFDDDGIFDFVSTGPNTTFTWGDDYSGVITLRVTDNDGLTDIDICNITVLNLNPKATIKSAIMEVEIGLRVAGRKYNDLGMTVYEDGEPVGYVSIERLPGSPNEWMAWIPMTLDMTKIHKATVTYLPEDPPNIGANPVWIYIKFENGSVEEIHHTFNVQQSKKRDSEHWNHVEPWEVDLNGQLLGCQFELTCHIIDPGSDDETLTYTYGSQTLTVTYLNNPPNPDPYPSPEVNPRDIMDISALVYEGADTLALSVEDDEGGSASASLDLA